MSTDGKERERMTEIKAVVGNTDEKRDKLIKMLFEGIRNESKKDGAFEVREQAAYKNRYIEPVRQQDEDKHDEISDSFWDVLDKTAYNAFQLGVYAAGLIFGEATNNADN